MKTKRTIVAILFAALAFVGSAVAQPAPETIRAATARSLTLLEKSAAEYLVHRKCFSCHHQALPIQAVTIAKAQGFGVDEKALHRQVKFTADFLEKNRENYEMGKGQGGQADTAGYALLTLAAGGWKADATTASVIEYLHQRDKNRDFWQATSQRPPSEASALTTTYLALAAFKNFAPHEKQDAIDARVKKAAQWLQKVRLKDTEDRVFHLRALKIAGAEDKHLLAASEELVKLQRKDGGWSQLAKLDSDAYATGSVLVALHQAGGIAVNDEAYQRGVQFLLKTQKDDGSWLIASRSRPFQAYFESGFPHGKNQWISCAGTSWATAALALACLPAFEKSRD